MLPPWLLQEAVKGIQYILELNQTFEEVYPLAVKICELIVDKVKLDGQLMCPGLISAYGPAVSILVAFFTLLRPYHLISANQNGMYYC